MVIKLQTHKTGIKPSPNDILEVSVTHNEGSESSLTFTLDEMKQMRPFLYSRGFSGHIPFHNWLQTNRPDYYRDHITLEDSEGLVMALLKKLKTFYYYDTLDIVIDASERFPNSLIHKHYVANKEKSDYGIIKIELGKIMRGFDVDYFSNEDKDDAKKYFVQFK